MRTTLYKCNCKLTETKILILLINIINYYYYYNCVYVKYSIYYKYRTTEL